MEAKHCRSLELKWRLTKSIDLKLVSEIDKQPNLRLILLEKWKSHLSNHANIKGADLEVKHCHNHLEQKLRVT